MEKSCGFDETEHIYFRTTAHWGGDWDGSGQIIYKGEYTENTLTVISFRGVYSSSQFSSTIRMKNCNSPLYLTLI